MKKALVVMLYFVIGNHAMSQTFQWAKNFGTTGQKATVKTTVKDSKGNIYSIGSYTGTVDFDPGTSVFNLTCFTNAKDVFLSKLDQNGNFVWAKRFGGNTDIFTDDANGFGIAIDLLGNVIVSGNFAGSIDLNPGDLEVFNRTSVGATDIFVVKLNSNGDFVWAKQIGGTGSDFPNDIITDNNNNILFVGAFSSTVDFDPNPTTFFNITTVGLTDIFIEKLDANGNFIFAKSMGGSGSDFGYGIALDSYSNIYTTGNFTGVSDFDPSSASSSTLTSAGGPDVFLSKLNASGNFVWAKGFGGTVSLFQDIANDIVLDANGNVYITGAFRGSNVDLDPGIGTHIVSSLGTVGGDAYLSKFNNSGDLIYSKTFGSSTTDAGFNIAIDDLENIYFCGTFTGNIDLDPDEFSDYVISTTGNSDIYLGKLDKDGIFVSATSIGSTGSEIPYSLFIDEANNIYCSGILAGNADFDPSISSSVNLTAQGIQDTYIFKWNQCLNPGSLSTSNITKQVSLNNTNASYLISRSNCEIISKVIPTGASPIVGNTTAKVWIESTQPMPPSGAYVKRHYEITPTSNATTATGRITLYFTQAEFNDFNLVSTIKLPTNPNDMVGIANLYIEKRPGTSTNGTGLPNTYFGNNIDIDPNDEDIHWNEGTNRWEVTFNTTGFSGFFAKGQSGVLPVRWIYFNGELSKVNKTTLIWKVFENNTIHYKIERSNDGINFNEISNVNTIGFGENEYQFVDPKNIQSTTFYRLKQVDLDGSFTYSEIVKLTPNNNKKIAVFPNPTSNDINIDITTNHLNKTATIIDSHGKMIRTFVINKLSYKLDVKKFIAGIYFIKIENEPVVQFIKQ